MSAQEVEALGPGANAVPPMDNPHARRAKNLVLASWIIFL